MGVGQAYAGKGMKIRVYKNGCRTGVYSLRV